MKKSIGWIAYNKNGDYYGGHNARCKVYTSYAKALSAQRHDRYVRKAEGGFTRIRMTDAEVLAEWEILEVFVEVPDGG